MLVPVNIQEENISCELFSKESRIKYSTDLLDGIHKDGIL